MSEAAATIEAPPAGAPSTPQPFNDAFSDLEGFTSAPGDEGPPKTGKAKASDMPPTDKGEVETPPDVDPKPDDKPHDKTPQDKAPEKPPQDKTPEKHKSRIVELSKAYEGLKAKHRQLEQDLLAKNAEIEAIKSKPAEDPEKKSLQERLAEREKRLADMESEMRFRHYEGSQEYKEKYEQPFIDAFQTGRQKTASLKIVEQKNEETGEVLSPSRQATAADFDRIAMIADDDAATELAHQMFGNKAPLILYHRERVQELNNAKFKAVEDYRKQGSEREKQFAEQSKAQREKMVGMFNQITNQAIEKFPELFKPVEGDDKGNELLKKGFDLVDSIFKNENVNQIPPDKLVAIHAAVRNRAAGFGRLLHQKRGLEAKVAELEKELADFRGSEPGAGAGDGKTKAKVEDGSDWESQMDKLARQPS